MPDPKLILGIAAGILSFAAYVLYIYTSIYGKTRPNRITWFVLTLVGILIALSYYSEGARNTIWISFAYVLGPFIVLIVSFWKGEGGWSKFDLLCLGSALISILIWVSTGSALIALVINLVIDFFGLLPTIKKSYLRPIGEDRNAWLLETLASFVNVLAIERWVFAIWIYPVYLLIINGIILLLLVRKSYFRSASPILSRLK